MKIATLLTILVILFESNIAFARCDSYPLVLYPTKIVSNDVPAHGAYPGKPFLDKGMSIWKASALDGTIFDMRWGGCFPNVLGMHKAYVTPKGKEIPGLVYQENGKTYSVFETGVPGIGYAVGVSDANVNSEIPLRNYTVKTYDGGHSITIGYKARLVFVVTTQSLKSGKYTIPSQVIAGLWALGAWEDGRDAPKHTTLSMATTSITIEAQGCQYNSPEKQHVKLPTISRDFQNHQADKYQSEFSVAISCDPSVAVYATMTDVHHPNSIDNILRGSPSSTAKGIGLQIYKSDDMNPINFGPDSTVRGNTNQWYLGGNKQTAKTTYTIPFRTQYVKLTNEENLTPGNFHAEASITFSYQ